MLRIKIFIVFLCTLTLPAVSDIVSENIDNFTKRPGFGKPLATTFGTIANLGFHQSARVGKGLGFFVGLPIMVAYRSNNDLFYTRTEPTNCKEVRQANPASTCQPDALKYIKVPSIMGPSKTAVHYLKINVDANGTPIDTSLIPAGGGLEIFDNLSTYPFLMPQAAISYFHTELSLRIVPIPFGNYSGNIFGVALQHDISSILGPKADKLLVDISIAAHANFLSLDCKFDDYKGHLELGGIAWGFGALIGKRVGPLEIFGEAAWERSILKMDGHLIKKSDADAAPIEPDLKLVGANNMKFGLNGAIHLGWYGSFGGYLGAQLGNLVNIFSYKKETNHE